MNNEHVEVEEREGVLTLKINRPDKLNAISPLVTEALWRCVREMAARADLRVFVITGAGRYFTAGIDLNATAERRERSRPDQPHAGWAYRRNYREGHLLYDEFENLEKPIVLAAQGTCLGAGVEMAASCDFRFCTPEARWGLPEIKLAVIPGSGGTSRLNRLVGPAWTKYLAMTGKTISAERALAIGLVQDVFPAESFMDEVHAFCRDLAGLSADALGLAKLAVDLSTDNPDRTGQRHLERIINTTLSHSGASRDKVSSFLEKRAPPAGTVERKDSNDD